MFACHDRLLFVISQKPCTHALHVPNLTRFRHMKRLMTSKPTESDRRYLMLLRLTWKHNKREKYL